MKMWTEIESTPRPPRKAEMCLGDLTLSVTRDAEERQWLWFALNISQFDDRAFDACKAEWPAEAIAIARRKLDELEAELEAEESCTTTASTT